MTDRPILFSAPQFSHIRFMKGSSMADLAAMVIASAVFSLVKWWFGTEIATAFVAGAVIAYVIMIWEASRREKNAKSPAPDGSDGR